MVNPSKRKGVKVSRKPFGFGKKPAMGLKGVAKQYGSA